MREHVQKTLKWIELTLEWCELADDQEEIARNREKLEIKNEEVMQASDGETRLRKHCETLEAINEQAERQLKAKPAIAAAKERQANAKSEALSTSAILQMALDLNSSGTEQCMRAKAQKAVAAKKEWCRQAEKAAAAAVAKKERRTQAKAKKAPPPQLSKRQKRPAAAAVARYVISKHQLSLVGVTLTSGLLRLAKALAHNECRFRATENASGNTWNISRDGTSHGGKCKTMSRYLVTNLMPGRLKLTPNITACLATQTTVFSCES